MEEPNLEVKKSPEGLFAMLQGTPSHVLIILGLAFALFAPLIVSFKGAGLASSQAEFEQINAQKELDLEEFKRDQQDRRAKSSDVARLTQVTEERKPAVYNPLLSPEQRDAQQKQEQEKERQFQELKAAVDDKDKEREKALEDKKTELDKKYDTIPIRRDIAESQTALAGTRSHLILGWLGRLMLLVGLLALVVQSDGLRQKVMLVVLLVVMFSALSGVNLDFLAQGRMGEPTPAVQRTTERAPEAPPSPKPSR